MTLKVNVLICPDWSECPAETLAAHLKHVGNDRYLAWDRFIILRALKPEINADKFFAIFDRVAPCSAFYEKAVDFIPTHTDTFMKGIECMVWDDERGVHFIVWRDGHTGSHPPCDEGFYTRFIPL